MNIMSKMVPTLLIRRINETDWFKATIGSW
jgi:hypothetical protein